MALNFALFYVKLSFHYSTIVEILLLFVQNLHLDESILMYGELILLRKGILF